MLFDAHNHAFCVLGWAAFPSAAFTANRLNLT